MKRQLLLLIGILFINQSFAQIKLPSQQSETKTPAKQSAPVKTTTTQNTYSTPVLTLKVTTDTDCNFYVDGEYNTTIKTGEIERLAFQPGEYQFKAVSAENSNDVYKVLFTVTKEETGTQKFYEIDLKSIAANRLKNENTELEKIEKAAKEKRDLENEQTAKETLKKEKEQEELLIAQTIKPFQGKIIFEVTWENIPQSYNMDFFKPGEEIYYCKNNKDRQDVKLPALSNTTAIYDYDKMETITITEDLVSKKKAEAVYEKMKQYPEGQMSITFLDEYKTIAGYKCQKALYKSPESDSQILCFVVRKFSSLITGYSSTNVAPFLMLETSWPVKFGDDTVIMHTKATSVSEEEVNDALVSFTAVPPGVRLIDKRR